MITSYELVEVVGEGVTAYGIVWARYRRPAFGIVEAMLDYNPQLAVIHQSSPIIPPGTYVMVPIDLTLLANGSPQPAKNFWSGQNSS